MTYLHVVIILYTCSMFHEEQILVTSNQEDKHIRYKDTVSVKTKTNIRYLCLFAYSGVQHIMCCGFFLSSPCAWWCPTYYVLWFFLSSPCVWWCPTYYVLWFCFVFALCMVVSNILLTNTNNVWLFLFWQKQYLYNVYVYSLDYWLPVFALHETCYTCTI
jgi:hypothetical protein